MKKLLLISGIALSNLAWAQFSSGTVNLAAAGMTVKLDTSPTTVTITLTGDSNSMLGIGFGNAGMAPGSDGFIYNSAATRDYTFGGYSTPSADTSQNWTETSNTVSGSTRTIVATRTLAGGSEDFAIPNAAGTISIYYARSAGSTAIAYHSGSRGYATLTMAGTLAVSDLALEGKKTTLYPNPARETISFKNSDKIQYVEIFDATGRKVKSVKDSLENIRVSDLKSGNYYVEIIMKDGSTSYQQLVKE